MRTAAIVEGEFEVAAAEPECAGTPSAPQPSPLNGGEFDRAQAAAGANLDRIGRNDDRSSTSCPPDVHDCQHSHDERRDRKRGRPPVVACVCD